MDLYWFETFEEMTKRKFNCNLIVWSDNNDYCRYFASMSGACDHRDLCVEEMVRRANTTRVNFGG